MNYGFVQGFSSGFPQMMSRIRGGRQKDEDQQLREQQAAQAEAIKQMLESAKGGAYDTYEDVNIPQADGSSKRGMRMSSQGAAAYGLGEKMGIGGDAVTDALQKTSDYKKTQIKMDINQKAVEGAGKLYESAGKIIDDMLKKEKAITDPNLKANVRKFYVDGINKLMAPTGTQIEVSSLDDDKTIKEKLQTKQIEGITSIYQEAMSKKTPEAVGQLRGALNVARAKQILPEEIIKAYETDATNLAQQVMKPPERPYKVGQFLPQQDEGNKHVTKQVVGYDEKGMPVTKVVATAPRYKNTSSEKPEYKPGQALKRIAVIDSSIAKLKSSGVVDTALAIQNPELAALLNSKDPEAAKQAIASLEQEREYVATFAPKGSVKPLKAQQPKKYKTAGEVKADYQAGKISKGEALRVLKNDFGMK